MPRLKPRYVIGDDIKNKDLAEKLLQQMDLETLLPGKSPREVQAKEWVSVEHPYQALANSFYPDDFLSNPELKAIRDALKAGFNTMSSIQEDLKQFASVNRDPQTYGKERWDQLMDKIDSLNGLQEKLYQFNEMTGYKYVTQPSMNAAFALLRGADNLTNISHEYACNQALEDIQNEQDYLDSNQNRIIVDLNQATAQAVAQNLNMLEYDKEVRTCEKIQKTCVADERTFKSKFTEFEQKQGKAANLLIDKATLEGLSFEYEAQVQRRKSVEAPINEAKKELDNIPERIDAYKSNYTGKAAEEYMKLTDELLSIENDSTKQARVNEINKLLSAKEENASEVSGFKISDYLNIKRDAQRNQSIIDRSNSELERAKELENQALNAVQQFANENELPLDVEGLKNQAEASMRTPKEIENEINHINTKKKMMNSGSNTADYYGEIKQLQLAHSLKVNQIGNEIQGLIGGTTSTVSRFRRSKEAYVQAQEMAVHSTNNITALQSDENKATVNINGALEAFTKRLGQNKRFLHRDSAEYKAMSTAIKNYQQNPSRDNMAAIESAATIYIDAKMAGRENDAKTTSMRDYRLNLAADLRDFAKVHKGLAEMARTNETSVETYANKKNNYTEIRDKTYESRVQNLSQKIQKPVSLKTNITEFKQRYTKAQSDYAQKVTEINTKMQPSIEKENPNIQLQTVEKTSISLE